MSRPARRGQGPLDRKHLRRLAGQSPWTSCAHELDVRPTDDQGGGHRTRPASGPASHLRRGEPFVWNATNLSRHVRGECIRLFAGYEAHVSASSTWRRRASAARAEPPAAAPVPEAVIERLLDRWEVPDRTEAHQVDWVVPS